MQGMGGILGLNLLMSGSPKGKNAKNWRQTRGNEHQAEVRYRQHKHSRQNDSCNFSISADWPPVTVRRINFPVLGHNRFLISQHCAEAAKSWDE